ncbi:MAG: hypothetical protein IJ056_01435 [Acidaminococcaceae bacterium]|nr:hypothetical protein [Acidaminococcaceae bacterium]
MPEEHPNWGGKRQGQGRPKGSKNKAPSDVRPQHQLRADPEEWELIRRFARLVKHGDMEKCRKALEKLENS